VPKLEHDNSQSYSGSSVFPFQSSSVDHSLSTLSKEPQRATLSTMGQVLAGDLIFENTKVEKLFQGAVKKNVIEKNFPLFINRRRSTNDEVPEK